MSLDRPALINYTGGKIQAKHLDERPILAKLLSSPSTWVNRWEVAEVCNPIVDTYRQLLLAKMRSLMDRKLVDGCCCGCRGDFHLTRKGIEYCVSIGMTPELQHYVHAK